MLFFLTSSGLTSHLAAVTEKCTPGLRHHCLVWLQAQQSADLTTPKHQSVMLGVIRGETD